MKCVDLGPMIVIDASCIYDIVTGAEDASDVRAIIQHYDDPVAPHLVDVEVIGLIRRDFQRAKLDLSAAELAVNELQIWPGERFDHRAFLHRVWELRGNVRTTDAFYVALAEALKVPLLTFDKRLSRAPGIRCEVITP